MILKKTAIKIDKTLFIVFNPMVLDWVDIRDIAERVTEIDPSIGVHITTPDDTASGVPPSLWNNRCVTVGLGLTGRFVPQRGPVFGGLLVPKLEQFARFRAANIATPMTERFEFGKQYDEAEWSEFVVLKPLSLRMTSKSGWSRLYRTRRLAELSPNNLPEDHFLRRGPALVQTLIDTGLYPSKWRVLSLFGDALYSSRTLSAVPRVSLDAGDSEIEASIIDAKNPYSSAADTMERRNMLIADPENPCLCPRGPCSVSAHSFARPGYSEARVRQQAVCPRNQRWWECLALLVTEEGAPEKTWWTSCYGGAVRCLDRSGESFDPPGLKTSCLTLLWQGSRRPCSVGNAELVFE